MASEVIGVLSREHSSEEICSGAEVAAREGPVARGVKRQRPGGNRARSLLHRLEIDVSAGMREPDGSRNGVRLTGAYSCGRARDRHTDTNLVRVAAPKGRAPESTPLSPIECAPVRPGGKRPEAVAVRRDVVDI